MNNHFINNTALLAASTIRINGMTSTEWNKLGLQGCTLLQERFRYII
jgi:hypothetical protein